MDAWRWGSQAIPVVATTRERAALLELAGRTEHAPSYPGGKRLERVDHHEGVAAALGHALRPLHGELGGLGLSLGRSDRTSRP